MTPIKPLTKRGAMRVTGLEMEAINQMIIDRKCGTRKDLDEEMYNVEDYLHDSGIHQAIATSEGFRTITRAVIFLNAVYIGVEVDRNHENVFSTRWWTWNACNNAFTVCFMAELVIRFLAFRRKYDCLLDFWFKFDAFVVAVMVVEDVLVPGWLFLELSSSFSAGPIRILRLLRLFRIGRLVSWLPELMLLSKALMQACRAVLSTILMIVLMLYCFGIVLLVFLRSQTGQGNRYKDLGSCMWTLTMHGLFLDGIGEIMDDLITAEQFFGVAVFMAFILLASTTLMNMLIGVLCEVVNKVQKDNEEEEAIELMKKSLLLMLKGLDDDGDGLISKKEFGALCEHQGAVQVLESLQVDVDHLLDVQQHLLFTNASPHLSIRKILDTILTCRGDRPATQQDITNAMKHLRWTIVMELERHQDRAEAHYEATLNRLIQGS